jgi:hypothetical protein
VQPAEPADSEFPDMEQNHDVAGMRGNILCVPGVPSTALTSRLAIPAV